MSENCLDDRISSLPDELLGHILSLLPTTRCAVRTSILSTRWRYLFTLTTCLCFDVAPCLSHPRVDEKLQATRRFKKFVDKVLELHRISSIEKLSLLCRGSHERYLDLNRWLSSAVQKGVQELHYELPKHICYGRVPCVCDCVPDGVFFCETLVKLTMIGFRYDEIQIPQSAWLPKLKIICLEHITFSDFDSMNSLFSSCEVLEELTLKSCNCDDDDDHVVYRSDILRVLTIEHCSFCLGIFEVDAPNLAYLTYNSSNCVKITPSWKYSASFVEAKLIVFDYCSYCEYERELLKAAADKTTELRFEDYSLEEVLFILGENEEMPDFSNLTKLVLHHFPYEAWKYVTSLIDKSPRLETIIFVMEFQFCCCDYIVSYSDPFSCHARLIEVHGFCGHENSLLLTGHLLRNASALKKMMIVYRDDDDYFHEDDDDYLDLEGKVSMLPRASKDSCIEIKKPRK